jgi:hypothetical protein
MEKKALHYPPHELIIQFLMTVLFTINYYTRFYCLYKFPDHSLTWKLINFCRELDLVDCNVYRIEAEARPCWLLQWMECEVVHDCL